MMPELREIVAAFRDPKVCDLCGYQNVRADKMAKHLALGHSKLDQLLQDEALVESKRELALARPKKTPLGSQCPICEVGFTKSTNREHVAWHFRTELKDMVTSMEDPTSCALCSYTSEKVENMAKHLALGHSKLDELMQDEQLVEQKKQETLDKSRGGFVGHE